MRYLIKVFIRASALSVALWVVSTPWAQAAPPILSEAAKQEDEMKKQEAERKKTPEEEKKEKEANELKKNIGSLGKRQMQDEQSSRVRTNVFPSSTPEADCTGADKARSRLDEVAKDAGIVIKGNLNINSKNEANVGKNEGNINSNTTINITNENNRRC